MFKMPVLPTAAQPWRRARVLSNQSSKNSPFLSFFLTILRQFGAFFAQFVKRQFYFNPGIKYDGALFPTLVLSRPNTTLIPSSIATGMCLILFVLLLILF